MALSVLVTGGAGFIGSHVVRALATAGHRVMVVDNLATGHREVLAPEVRFIYGDVTRPAAWEDAVPSLDVVIHLAAQVSVPRGEARPVDDAEVNVVGTLETLEVARRHGAREVRFASSAAVYGTPERLPLDVADPLRPTSFYGISKAAAEWAVVHYTTLHQMTGVAFRIANCYGPGQRAEGEGAVVAAFAEGFAAQRPTRIHGDGRQTRDFIFVGDVARAFVHRLGASESAVLPLCTGAATTIVGLWQELARIAGVPDAVPTYGPVRAGDIRDSVLDPRPAAAWGFRAATPLTEGLEATYQAWQSSRSDT